MELSKFKDESLLYESSYFSLSDNDEECMNCHEEAYQNNSSEYTSPENGFNMKDDFFGNVYNCEFDNYNSDDYYNYGIANSEIQYSNSQFYTDEQSKSQYDESLFFDNIKDRSFSANNETPSVFNSQENKVCYPYKQNFIPEISNKDIPNSYYGQVNTDTLTESFLPEFVDNQSKIYIKNIAQHSPDSMMYHFKAPIQKNYKTHKNSNMAAACEKKKIKHKIPYEKGALQCKGTNRKKNTRCRNAALMEYIGPRPLYCAEHITLDPNSLYTKCKSSFYEAYGDRKGCREVVLKEFSYCYKHYDQVLEILLNLNSKSIDGCMIAQKKYERVSYLLDQLKSEALAVRKIDSDLFQRKHKLIPKFSAMKALLKKRISEFLTQYNSPDKYAIEIKTLNEFVESTQEYVNSQV